MQGLTLTAALEDALRSALSTANLSSFNAVHIRRGDIIADLKTPKPTEFLQNRAVANFVARFADLKAYVSLLNRPAFQDSPILACSDCTDSVIELRDRVRPRRVHTMKDLVPTLAGLSTTQADFLDIALMARCHVIITAGSNFPAFSALLGDVPLRDARFSMSVHDLEVELHNICRDRADYANLSLQVKSAYVGLYRRQGATEKEVEFQNTIRLPDSTSRHIE